MPRTVFSYINLYSQLPTLNSFQQEGTKMPTQAPEMLRDVAARIRELK